MPLSFTRSSDSHMVAPDNEVVLVRVKSLARASLEMSGPPWRVNGDWSHAGRPPNVNAPSNPDKSRVQVVGPCSGSPIHWSPPIASVDCHHTREPSNVEAPPSWMPSQ